MKITFLIFFLICFNFSYSQNCNDGILNGDEITVDCGGFYCPKCETNDNPAVQNIVTHSKVGELIFGVGTLMAIDSAGTRAIVSCYRTGHKSIYTMSTDGSYIAEIFDYNVQDPGGSYTEPYVDISRDGTKVLWALPNRNGIYVADFDGGNRMVVADKLKNQEEDSGEIVLRTFTTPKFNADGTSIIFSHSANGSKNRGIWEVGINQSLATNQLINVEDLSDAFTETIWNLGGNMDFFQLKITENDHVQFLTNLLNENSGYSDLMIFKDGNLEMVADNEIFNAGVYSDQHTISKDGRFSFWINPWNSDAIYYKKDHETGLTTTYDLVREFNGIFTITRILSNNDGSLLLLSGTQTGGGAGQNVLVKPNGDEYYPIHITRDHWINPLNSIPFIVLSERNEKLIYTVAKSPDPFEVWLTDVTPSNILPTKYPALESFSITNNRFIPGQVNNSRFELNVSDGENESVDKLLLSTFADDTLHMAYYLDQKQLFDDGSSYGDAAVDNQYTHNNMYYSNQGQASERELPYKFSVRFNLFTENHITSYDVYPFFMVDEVSAVGEIENKSVRIYPTLLNNRNTTINVEIDFPFNKASWNVYDMNGKKIKSSSDLVRLNRIDLESLTEGIYVIQFQIDNKIITKKIIVGA